MKNIDWKRKLTSRKFWAAVVGFVTPTLLAFGVSDSVVTQVAGIIMAGATCIAYIIGEGLVDANRTDAKAETDEAEADITAFADDFSDAYENDLIDSIDLKYC